MCTKHGLILFHELEELVANRAKEKAAELEAADGKALPRPPASTEGAGDGAEGAQVTFVDDSPKVSPTAARKQALEQRLLKAENTGAAGGATGGFNNLQDERVLLLELLVGCSWGATSTIVAADRKRRGGKGPQADLRLTLTLIVTLTLIFTLTLTLTLARRTCAVQRSPRRTSCSRRKSTGPRRA